MFLSGQNLGECIVLNVSGVVFVLLEEDSRLVGRNMIYRGECTVATAFVCGNIAVTVATSLQIALNIQL